VPGGGVSEAPAPFEAIEPESLSRIERFLARREPMFFDDD